jgi:KDO2-lipid IV(A) lauroyltransferase
MEVNKKVRRQFQYILVRTLTWLFQALPRTFVLWLAGRLAPLAWHLMSRERAKVLFNLRLIFPERNNHESLGQAVFRNLAFNAVDAIRIPKLSRQELEGLVEVRGLEHFDRAYRLGKGVVAVTGHIGCWELIPAWFASRGYSISVIGKRIYDDRLDSLLTEMRSSQGVQTIDRETGAKQALQTLHAGGALGILIDQDTRVSSVDVDFFGHQARTPTGAAALAAKAQAAVIPLAIHRRPDGSHLLTVMPVLAMSQHGDRDIRLSEDVQKQTSAIEELVRKDITQWVWMHLRWAEKPKA